MSDQFTRRALGVALGDTPTAAERYWPTLPGTGIGGTVLTTGNAVWGAWTDIAAAAAIATEYWVCGIAVYTPNQIQVWQLQLGTAAGAATIAEFMVDITAATVNVAPMKCKPIYRAGSAATTGRAGGAGNAKTINVHIIYNLGL